MFFTIITGSLLSTMIGLRSRTILSSLWIATIWLSLWSLSSFTIFLIFGPSVGGALATAVAVSGYLIFCGSVFGFRSIRISLDRNLSFLELTGVLFLLLILMTYTYSFLLSSIGGPHGGWDAWAMWNSKARFLVADKESWLSFLHPGLSWMNNNYPLNTPMLISLFWRGLEERSQWAPILIALFSAIGTIAILVSSVSFLTRPIVGVIAGGLLLYTTVFEAATAQYADTPLMLLFVVSFSAFLCGVRSQANRFSCFFISLLGAIGAAWTKLEGVPFGILILGFVLVELCRVRTQWSKKDLVRLCLVVAVPFLMLAYFRLVVAPPGYLANLPHLSLIDGFVSGSRHSMILNSFWSGFIQLRVPYLPYCLGIALVLAAWRRSCSLEFCYSLVIFLGMAAAYYGVYLVTPFELSWHLDTSFNRISVQLSLWGVFLSVFSLIRVNGEKNSFSKINLS